MRSITFVTNIESDTDLGNHIALIIKDPVPNAGLTKEMVTIFIEITDLATDVDSRSDFATYLWSQNYLCWWEMLSRFREFRLRGFFSLGRDAAD